MFELPPYVDCSASRVTKEGLLSHCLWSPVVSWKAGSFQGRVQAFRRVGMHSHLGETGFTRLWWIQGAISATLAVVRIDKITTKGSLQWGFNGWTFYSFTQTVSPFFFFFWLRRISMATTYFLYIYTRKIHCLKKVKNTVFLSIKEMSRASKNNHFVSI
jgi:hypothetical protein